MSTLPAPSCGRIVKPLYFLLKNYSPGWLLETCFCFPKGGAKAPVCAGLHFLSTVVAGPALASEHVGASSWVWLQSGGRCVGLSLRVWGAHDPGGEDP